MSDYAADNETDASAFFSWNAFGYGLLFFAVLSLLVLMWLWLSADDTLQSRASQLGSITVIVERTTEEPPEVVAEVQETPPPALVRPAWSSDVERMANGMVDTVPVPGLSEDTKYGTLPIIRKTDGLTPFAAYRRPFNPAILKQVRGIVTIVVSDIGLSNTASTRAIERLPPEVTLELSPYSPDAVSWREAAHAGGHEVWLSLPMEAPNLLLDDSGPMTLMTNTSLDVTINKLSSLLATASGYAGVIPSRGTVFYSSDIEAKEVAKRIFEHGLGYVDATENLQLTPQSTALVMDAPYAYADIWLDDDATAPAIQEQLQKLDEMVLSKGYAIAFMRPLPVTYDEVTRWIATLKAKNIALAPLSAQTGLLR